jgi:hypothetical protein
MMGTRSYFGAETPYNCVVGGVEVVITVVVVVVILVVVVVVVVVLGVIVEGVNVVVAVVGVVKAPPKNKTATPLRHEPYHPHGQ